MRFEFFCARLGTPEIVSFVDKKYYTRFIRQIWFMKGKHFIFQLIANDCKVVMLLHHLCIHCFADVLFCFNIAITAFLIASPSISMAVIWRSSYHKQKDSQCFMIWMLCMPEKRENIGHAVCFVYFRSSKNVDCFPSNWIHGNPNILSPFFPLDRTQPQSFSCCFLIGYSSKKWK